MLPLQGRGRWVSTIRGNIFSYFSYIRYKEIRNMLELIIRRSTGFLRRLVSKYICGKEFVIGVRRGIFITSIS